MNTTINAHAALSAITVRESDEHNRTIIFDGLPTKYRDDPVSLKVCLKYAEENDGARVHKAVTLDNIIIPAICRAVNSHADLAAVAELSRRNVGSILHMLPLNADKTERKSLEKWLGELNAALGKAGIF